MHQTQLEPVSPEICRKAQALHFIDQGICEHEKIKNTADDEKHWTHHRELGEEIGTLHLVSKHDAQLVSDFDCPQQQSGGQAQHAKNQQLWVVVHADTDRADTEEGKHEKQRCIEGNHVLLHAA